MSEPIFDPVHPDEVVDKFDIVSVAVAVAAGAGGLRFAEGSSTVVAGCMVAVGVVRD